MDVYPEEPQAIISSLLSAEEDLAIASTDAQLAELISEAWKYLNNNELWTIRYSSLLALKEDIDYDNVLRPVLDRHQANNNRKRGQMRTILGNWERLPDAALPSDLRPPVFSASFLGALAALSKICSIDVAISLLRSSIHARKSTPQAHKHDFLTTSDISNAQSSSQLRIDAQSDIHIQHDDEDSEGNISLEGVESVEDVEDTEDTEDNVTDGEFAEPREFAAPQNTSETAPATQPQNQF
ncbi:hypothetical protein FGG08_006058 [Glutinoglossum americanum]|uniref:Uncharacterized protein n=1 Tax=Glutinoglossum americanum TaxID=1670608 RepID=A0A9P8I216_9PEZI|nr:hypothetical protein FGG08_006058 [Glutinoglossum americanum]